MTGEQEIIPIYRKGLVFILFFAIPLLLDAQLQDRDSSEFTLKDCIRFALENQPAVRQSVIGEKIAGKTIRISNSEWYPQVGFDAGLQHYLDVPINSSGNPASSVNVSSGVFSASQAIFSNRLLLNARSSHELRNQAAQGTESMMITTCVNVTKAFFDVLLTVEQIKVLDAAIQRLQKNYDDALSLYRNGLTDRTDYQRTEISLSNARAQRNTARQSVSAKYAILKQLMGIPPAKDITVAYDTSGYENEILADTSSLPDFSRRVEYRQLRSEMNLRNMDISYYRWSFLPGLSAFYNYNTQYYNDTFSELYSRTYPSSVAGLKLSLPLFSGFERIHSLGRAKLEFHRLELEMDNLKNEFNSEYTLALSRYKSSLNTLATARKNIVLATDIFNTVRLQYEKGIKAYLEVIVSETDLRTAELTYLDTLFQVLSAKLDLERASGTININLQ